MDVTTLPNRREDESTTLDPSSGAVDFVSAAQKYADDTAYRKYAGDRINLAQARPMKEIDDKGRLFWNFHPGQMKVMESRKRFIIALAGRQSGKSESGAPWLYEEMKARGPGWYMVVAPTYPVLEDSALPKFLELFERDLQLGVSRQSPLRFLISPDGERRLWGHAGLNGPRQQSVVRFGHGTNPSSLEAKTSKACWIDEGGQPEFKRESFEAIEGRHTTTQGRILVTTTPYDLGFLKQRFFDPWEAAGRDHPEIDIISWKSIANPTFPLDEYNRLKTVMPAWRHAMFYDGEFSIPAGLIFDIVRERESEIAVAPFDIPNNWPRYAGLDFGGINTCAVFAALDPKENQLYLYTTYYPAEARRIRDHADAVRKTASGPLERVIGGAKSEGQWRDEFYEGGLRVEEPSIGDLHVGIGRMYSLFAAGRLKVFDSSVEKMMPWWNQIYSYRYETDAATGDTLPDMKIIEQNKYHFLDSSRYLCSGFGDLISMGAAGYVGGQRTVVDNYREMNAEIYGPRGTVKPEERMGRTGRSSARTRVNIGFRGNPILRAAEQSRSGRGKW